MSENSSGRPPRFLFPLLGVLVLVSGGVFFQSNRSPSRSTSQAVAVAAPKPLSPKNAIRPKAATKAERTAAQKTIAAQLHAFNTGNWAEAVKFQSQGLKGNFASPEAFGDMIQKVYPVFVRPKKVEYGPSINLGGHIQFGVALTGQDGSVTHALYSLVKEEGNYRVEGVQGGAVPPPAEDGNASIV